MTCCSQLTRKEFLETKLRNFKAYVEPFCISETTRARLNSFQDLDTVMPYLLQAVALSRAGQLDAAVDSFCAEFPEAPQEFRVKISRYLSMFVDVLTS